jgi:hypothetical protein
LTVIAAMHDLTLAGQSAGAAGRRQARRRGRARRGADRARDRGPLPGPGSDLRDERIGSSRDSCPRTFGSRR